MLDDRRWLEPPEEEKPLLHCDICGDPFFEGDVYYSIDGERKCRRCMENDHKRICTEE